MGEKLNYNKIQISDIVNDQNDLLQYFALMGERIYFTIFQARRKHYKIGYSTYFFKFETFF